MNLDFFAFLLATFERPEKNLPVGERRARHASLSGIAESVNPSI
jgi:hypothetical protein